jgi:hypothetical protein
LSPVADDLSFRPSDGTEVTRLYSIDIEYELGDLSVVIDGQDISEMIPSDVSGTAQIAMKLTESFVRSADGRPLELIRSFEEMSGEASAMGESEAIEEIDKLEGKRVRFVWNEEEGDYDVDFHESEGDAEDLEGLTADMDLRALLPGKEVAVGDTWTVDGKQLSSVLMLGDKPQTGESEVDQLFESAIWPQLETLLERFKITCEYQGEREVDGRKVGAVGVAMHGEGSLDLSELIRSMVQLQAQGMEVDIDVATADLAVKFDSKGEVLWDLAAGHLRAYDMGCDSDLALDVSMTAGVQGQSQEIDADVELSASGTWKIAPVDG